MSHHLHWDSQVRTGLPDHLRRFLHGIVYLMRTDILWRDLPDRFGHWNSVFHRFHRWCRNRFWKRMLTAVAAEHANLAQVHSHSSYVRGHISAVRAATAPSFLADAVGRLVRVRLTPGQVGNTPQAKPLLARLWPGHAMADRAYDADALRNFIIAQGGEPVIPGCPNRKVSLEHNRELYRKRNVVERGISWFKQCRRLVTRFEKTASSYLGLMMFVAMRH